MTPKEREERIDALETLLANFTRAGRLRDARCVAAMEELNRLRTPGLQFRRSLDAIRAAAERRVFLTYGDVAVANDITWRAARMRMDPHLFDICRWATARGWPLLTAIVVDQDSRGHGGMTGVPLIGFARCAERCSRIVGADPAAFLRAEQQRVFDWAEKERGHDLHH